ncbi:S-layer homology domain-containing protein [Brachybacterium muris]|uniref:S-layer homology domain-containing protein n=1 Tax=Brachybacterium muris TaxID=219301 RepID=UPI00223B5356
MPRSMMFATEMCWMMSADISTGWSDGTYRPLQSVKRDAMAAFLQRYDAKF